MKAKDLTVLGLLIALMAILSFVPNLGFITIGIVSISIVHLPVVIGAILLGWKKGLILSLAFGLLSFLRAFTPAGAADIVFQSPLISVLPRLFIGFGTLGVFSCAKKLFTAASLRLSKKTEKSKTRIAFISAMLVCIGIFSAFFAVLTYSANLGPWAASLISVACAGAFSLFGYKAVTNGITDPARLSTAFACGAGAVTNTIFTLLAFYVFVPVFFNNVLVAGGLSDIFVQYLLGLAAVNGTAEAACFILIGTPITLALLKITKKEKNNASGT